MGSRTYEILVIDDDAQIRGLVRKILEGAGIDVCDAESVSQAFEVADQRGPHAVITDLMMPDEDGFAFLEKRKSVASLKRTPILVLSAVGDKKSVFRAMSLGASDYSVKPFTSKELLQKVRKLLKDQSFGYYEFEKESRPEISVQSPASLLMVRESGFLLDAPMRVQHSTQIDVRSDLLDRLKIKDCHLRVSSEPPRPGAPGRYLHEVDVIGIPPNTAKHIRTTLRSLK